MGCFFLSKFGNVIGSAFWRWVITASSLFKKHAAKIDIRKFERRVSHPLLAWPIAGNLKAKLKNTARGDHIE
jgi:hypothetical protein